MRFNPHKVTQYFEAALCDYTGAPFAVAVNSCTMALTLSVAYHLRNAKHTIEDRGTVLRYHRLSPAIEIPSRTYVSVPMAIIHAGGRPTFRDEEWDVDGYYQLGPLPVFDSARRFSQGMYHAIKHANAMVCVSFHASKSLGIEQGGAILHDDEGADYWLRQARFDGRLEGVPPAQQSPGSFILGWHCYMNPSSAAQGLLKLHSLPKHNDPVPGDDYPDLSQMEIFK